MPGHGPGVRVPEDAGRRRRHEPAGAVVPDESEVAGGEVGDTELAQPGGRREDHVEDAAGGNRRGRWRHRRVGDTAGDVQLRSEGHGGRPASGQLELVRRDASASVTSTPPAMANPVNVRSPRGPLTPSSAGMSTWNWLPPSAVTVEVGRRGAVGLGRVRADAVGRQCERDLHASAVHQLGRQGDRDRSAPRHVDRRGGRLGSVGVDGRRAAEVLLRPRTQRRGSGVEDDVVGRRRVGGLQSEAGGRQDHKPDRAGTQRRGRTKGEPHRRPFAPVDYGTPLHRMPRTVGRGAGDGPPDARARYACDEWGEDLPAVTGLRRVGDADRVPPASRRRRRSRGAPA